MPEPSRSPRRKPPSRYHHGDLRRALVEEVVHTIARDGVDGLTLREVGRRLGVSRTALYRHFADKGTLLAAVAREGFERLRADLAAAWSQSPGTRRGFESMGAAYVRFAVENPSHYRVMFGASRQLAAEDADLHAAGMRAFQVLVDALQSLQASGQVRRDDLLVLAQYIWAIVHGIAMLAINGQLGPESSVEAQLAALVPLALKRLRTGIERDLAGPRA
jgi:AcrR family transcriptional regulator